MGVNNREKEGWGSSVASTCLADTVRLGDRPQHRRKQRNNIIINNNKNQVPKKGNIGLKEPDTQPPTGPWKPAFIGAEW